MEVKVIGQMDNTIDHTFESANRVYDVGGVSPTINTCGGGGLQPKILEDMNPRLLGGIGEKWGDKQYRQGNRVYDANGVAMALTAQPLGNNGGNSYMYLTEEKSIVAASTILVGYERANMTGFNADNGVIEKVGQIEGSFEQSGRVYNSKGIAPTIMSNSHGNTTGGYTPHKIAVAEALRIRKLTPRECWRLMDFTDEDFENAAEVNSNTQLYKQAGNSIVRNVLVAILGQMISGKEDVYKQ